MGRLILDSVRIYFSRLPTFLLILIIPATIVAAGFVSIAIFLLGFTSTGIGIDPASFALSITKQQWTVISAGGLTMAIGLALSMAATIHASAEFDSVGAAKSFRLITAKSMQIFWLQLVIYALAARFSPAAGVLLWVLIAFGIPVAIREDLGPADAMDRAWALSNRARLSLLGLEAALMLPVLATVAAVAYLFLIPGPWFNLNRVSPQIRLLLSWPITAVLLLPVQFMFVVLARAYVMCRDASDPPLHARAASGVSSS